jgi:hypothetical protein
MLRLGIIGLSPGNGHPYSWSAIFNGYDPVAMAECPFVSIPKYLAKQRFPQDAIVDAKVTHVWTQDAAISHSIAAASLVPNVVSQLSQMVGAVDAVLLARDDAAMHGELARDFLRHGTPIFIDKPLALARAEAEKLYAAQSYEGQIFTGSALAYAREYEIDDAARAELGAIRHLSAVVPKSWNTYAIHAIDPMLKLLARYDRPVSVEKVVYGAAKGLRIGWQDGPTAQVIATGGVGAPFSIEIFCDNAYRRMVWEDAFACFRSSLQRFVSIVRRQAAPQEKAEILAAVDLIEAGS